MVKSKADRIRNVQVPVDESHGHRLPPGQVVTEKFPILHEGNVPVYDLATWTLRTFGEVEREQVFRFDDIMAMDQTSVVTDIHCVTRWSKFDTKWQGVLFTDLVSKLEVRPEAKFVMVHGDNDYTAVVPMADLMRPEVILAHSYNDRPLTDKHGWPLRLVVPHLYFWKSVKWVRGFDFMREYRDGFWEQNGFHAYGDPFTEQRFSGDPLDLPEDEWTHKEFD